MSKLCLWRIGCRQQMMLGMLSIQPDFFDAKVLLRPHNEALRIPKVRFPCS